jgi:hypothetical protein
MAYNYNTATYNGGVLNSGSSGADFSFTTTSTDFYSNQANNQKGGALNIQTTTSPVTISITSGSVRYNYAGTSGGFVSTAGSNVDMTFSSTYFYYLRANNGHGGFAYIANTGTTTITSTSSHWENMGSTQDGGVFRVTGSTDVTITMSNSDNYIYNTWANAKGGAYSIDATGTLTLTMESSTYMDYVSATGNGGGMYLCAATNILVFKTSAHMSRIWTSSNGGAIYTCATATGVELDWNSFSTTDIRASTQGSILFVEGDAAPTINFNLESNTLYC